jgi:HD superfamily phosphohydrolase
VTVVTDVLHGTVAVEEPVLVALLEAPALRRLRDVHQAGAVWLVRPERCVTRWEHSVGTMLLVARLGGDVEQQAAALVHDAGHGAFSHVIDRVFDRADDGWHDDEGLALLRRSELPALLARHGLDAGAVLAAHAWPLLDRPAPALCADRVDYALRDAVCEGLVSVDEARAFLDALVVTGDGTLAVGDVAPAQWFADRFHELVETVFCDPLGVWADWTLAGAIRRALHLGALEEPALLGTDVALLARLRAIGDPEILAALAALVPGAAAVTAASAPDHIAWPKPRTVDPPVLAADGTAVPVSRLVPAVGERATALRARLGAGLGIRASAR